MGGRREQKRCFGAPAKQGKNTRASLSRTTKGVRADRREKFGGALKGESTQLDCLGGGAQGSGPNQVSRGNKRKKTRTVGKKGSKEGASLHKNEQEVPSRVEKKNKH